MRWNIAMIVTTVTWGAAAMLKTEGTQDSRY